ncbi:MAG: adenosylhomocysteinase [Spirochaetaceae bacterium]|nr:MAG: adenosylhomocysteinase [Spirochaetaceae bacterium]
MVPSRIKDPNLAAQIDEVELAWYRHVTPITEHYSRQIAQRDYRGKKFAYWGHITLQNTVQMMMALKQAGVDIAMGACNVDSTNDAAAAYAASKGIHVYGWQGMSQADYEENLALVRSFEADYLCDMGGELSAAYLDKIPPVKGALEATTSGLNLLKKHELPFPVFDWNSIPLKDRLENRFHVGDGVWPVFSQVTGMGLFGRRVLVIGYGPVGKGIAERARNLGAIAHVADLDPVRLIEARHHGCETVSLDEGLARCQIIVTATGVEGVVREQQLRRVRSGAIFFNAGHSNREIDIDWLYDQPHQRMKAHIERFNIGENHLFLLAKGSLLNLAAGVAPNGIDMFDHYTAVMLLGTAWMFNGIPDDIKPGLQRYPAHLEREIAQLSVEIHGRI